MKKIISPFGKRDVLEYYSIVAKKLKKFLKNKEIATKVWLPTGFFLKRGSKEIPLYIQEMKVSKKLMELRSEMKLNKAREKISKKEEKIWKYFPQDKLIEFFYATNKEGKNKPIERIFIDIDRGKNITAEQSRKVALILVEMIKKDKEFRRLIKFKIFIMWTGKSFHVYLLLKKQVPNNFYGKYLAYSKHSPLENFIGKWAKRIEEQLKINIAGGHEKKANEIILDPSGTPSGKLARCPFSLHIKNAKEIDGISVPLNEKMLRDINLIKKLGSLTPEKVLKNLNSWAKNTP